MLIILSPSKTQRTVDRHFPHSSQPVFLDETLYLANHLKSLKKPEIAKLMKTGEKLTESTFQRIHTFTPPFTLRNTRQAIFTFQGDAYSQLTPESYHEEELFYAQHHLRILSGLYGILRPLDLIFPYRLEMGTKLNTEKATDLYDYWSDSVTACISSPLKKMESRVLIDLSSTEYFKTINTKNLQGKIITIIFRQLKNGVSKTIPIYSKRARGLMTHFAITSQLKEAEGLKSFNLDGYSYQEKASAKEIWIFEKEL